MFLSMKNYSKKNYLKIFLIVIFIFIVMEIVIAYGETRATGAPFKEAFADSFTSYLLPFYYK